MDETMVAEIARNRRRATAMILSGPCTAVAVAVLQLAAPAFGADLNYGSLGPQPYIYQPPPYDHGTYPSPHYLAPRESPYGRRSYIYQPPTYDGGAPVYPSPPYLSSREGPYSERYTYRGPPYDDGRSADGYDMPRYGYRPSDRVPTYPSYRLESNNHVHSYSRDGSADPSYDPYGRGHQLRSAGSRGLPILASVPTIERPHLNTNDGGAPARGPGSAVGSNLQRPEFSREFELRDRPRSPSGRASRETDPRGL